MMIYLLGLVLITVASVQARTFNNPILADKPYYEPSAIKVNGTYYVVAWTSEPGVKIPIHTSTDLITWEAAGYVIDANNTPTWAVSSTYEPEIHKIGSNFVVYFDAHNSSSTIYAVGAAVATQPLGPYTVLNQPIQPLLNESQSYPTIINDQDKLYLVWSSEGVINARPLNASGLGYSSDQTTTLIKPSLTWEGNFTWSPWYVRRGSYHYILYSGAECGAGVARSSNALGPYEKLPNPILVDNIDYECTRDMSVVKDLDDIGDVVFFTGRPLAVINKVNSIVLASLSWGADDWPYIEDF